MDRTRLKKRLNTWRIVAITLGLALILSVITNFEGMNQEDYIANVNITGIIVDDRERSKALSRLANDEFVKAIILHINSPGGTVVGGEVLHHEIKAIAKTKPVVAVIHDVGTSAAYMVAVASDRIFTRQSSIVGSIGVIVQTTDITGMLQKIGIKPFAIKSSPMKAQPNPLEPLSKKARIAIELLVTDMFDMFITMVVKGRNLNKAEVKELADGRVFTGRQAIKYGLTDAIGGENEALEWLSTEKKIQRELPLKLISVDKQKGVLKNILDQIIGKISISDRLRLDGLVSLWHPKLQ